MEDALRWLAVLQDGAIPPAEQRAFEVLLAASPAHRDAWQRAQYVWARVDILAPVLRDRRATSDPVLTPAAQRPNRSEERRVGKACVGTYRYRWSPSH